MSKETIKPCPFCGTIPEVDQPFGNSYYVGCSPCSGDGTIEVVQETRTEAIGAWNSRTPSEADKLKDAVISWAESVRLRNTEDWAKGLMDRLNDLSAHLDKREGAR